MRTTPNNTTKKELSLRSRVVLTFIGTALVELAMAKTHFFHGWGDALGNCVLFSICAAISYGVEKVVKWMLKEVPILLQKLPDSGDLDSGLQLNSTMDTNGANKRVQPTA